MNPRRYVGSVLSLVTAVGFLFGHSPVNIINSSDRPWFALVKPREGSLRVRIEYGKNLPARSTERRFAQGQKGACQLEPDWVLSLQADGGATTCCAIILLMDEAGDLSAHGMYHYLAPGPPERGGRGMLRPLCDFGLPQKAVRQPEPSVLQILRDAWPLSQGRPSPLQAWAQRSAAAGPAPECTEAPEQRAP